MLMILLLAVSFPSLWVVEMVISDIKRQDESRFHANETVISEGTLFPRDGCGVD